jgi:hypothetical protein
MAAYLGYCDEACATRSYSRGASAWRASWWGGICRLKRSGRMVSLGHLRHDSPAIQMFLQRQGRSLPWRVHELCAMKTTHRRRDFACFMTGAGRVWGRAEPAAPDTRRHVYGEVSGLWVPAVKTDSDVTGRVGGLEARQAWPSCRPAAARSQRAKTGGFPGGVEAAYCRSNVIFWAVSQMKALSHSLTDAAGDAA